MLIASAANVYVLIPAVIVMAVLLGMRWYYLKTSRDIKRLEAVGTSITYCLVVLLWSIEVVN